MNRLGIGRALVEAACEAARADGVKIMLVCTLHPTVAYEPYERTRRFYKAVGFRVLFEKQVPDEVDPLAFYEERLG